MNLMGDWEATYERLAMKHIDTPKKLTPPMEDDKPQPLTDFHILQLVHSRPNYPTGYVYPDIKKALQNGNAIAVVTQRLAERIRVALLGQRMGPWDVFNISYHNGNTVLHLNIGAQAFWCAPLLLEYVTSNTTINVHEGPAIVCTLEMTKFWDFVWNNEKRNRERFIVETYVSRDNALQRWRQHPWFEQQLLRLVYSFIDDVF